MSLLSLKWRLFLTCWVVFVIHFATDFVREHYLVVSMVDDHSFRLDPYADLHVDIFWNPDSAPHQGAHHGANPGISFVGAVPYFLLKPAVDVVVDRSLAARKAHPDTTVSYNDPRWRRVEFYRKVRERGLDIRFGLVSAITQAFAQAPLSALSVVVLFSLLISLGLVRSLALTLSLAYAFATPIFFRTAYLNQNISLGLFAFFAMVIVWNPGGRSRFGLRSRYVMAGLLGGLAFLCDYSGALMTGMVGLYALIKRRDESGSWGRGFLDSLWYGLGALPGVLLLWFYQWAAFGSWWRPPQHWMPPVEWADIGYQGVGGFSFELLRALLFEPRYGLFVTSPLFLLALAAPFLAWRRRGFLPRREMLLCLIVSAVFVVFFSFVQYTRLQWVTGIRYLAAILPFMFLAAAAVLVRLPKVLAAGLLFLSLVINWSLAMVRSQGSVLDNVERVFIAGFQLPWLTVIGKTAAQYAPWLQGGVSPLFILGLTAGVIVLIWWIRDPWKPLAGGQE